ncbi:hypothetical protein [Paraburkholderia tropica]|uniref:hypothetical protein n=1 Tax=Paraburkholderia tropica TaxID=92647 RepID=UPI002AB7CFB4|nr:hypothetical protein [Paraburkholderia tropica]
MMPIEDARRHATERAAQLGLAVPDSLLDDVATLLATMQDSARQIATEHGTSDDAHSA